jgi:preprotein translocase subunit SecD
MGIASLVLVCVAASQPSQGGVAQESGSRSEWVYSLDLERARAIGWGSAESSPADVLRIAFGLLGRRLSALDEGVGVEPTTSEARIVIRSIHPFDEEQSRRLDSLIRSIGVIEFGIVAEHSGEEYERLRSWSEARPGANVIEFDLVPFEQGGPHPSLLWLPGHEAAAPPFPILLPERFDRAFGAADFERAYPAVDNIGYPAIGFALKAARRSEFREFTRKYKSRAMAIVLDEQVVSAPIIEEELPGEGIIRGRRSQEEVDAAVRRIQSLEGPFRPSS